MKIAPSFITPSPPIHSLTLVSYLLPLTLLMSISCVRLMSFVSCVRLSPASFYLLRPSHVVRILCPSVSCVRLSPASVYLLRPSHVVRLSPVSTSCRSSVYLLRLSVYLLRLFMLYVFQCSFKHVIPVMLVMCVMCYVSSRFIYLPIHSNTLKSISLKA